VSSVAERGIPGSFALAEEGLAILFRDEGLGGEIASTMRAVAERLASGFATTAEVIGLAGLKFHANGLTGCYLGFAHTLRRNEDDSEIRPESKTQYRGDFGSSLTDLSPQPETVSAASSKTILFRAPWFLRSIKRRGQGHTTPQPAPCFLHLHMVKGAPHPVSCTVMWGYGGCFHPLN